MKQSLGCQRPEIKGRGQRHDDGDRVHSIGRESAKIEKIADKGQDKANQHRAQLKAVGWHLAPAAKQQYDPPIKQAKV